MTLGLENFLILFSCTVYFGWTLEEKKTVLISGKEITVRIGEINKK